MLVEGIGRERDLDPFAAPGNDRERRELGVCNPHVVLDLGHVLFGRRLFGERPGKHEFGLEHRPRTCQRVAPIQRLTGWRMRRCTSVTCCPVFRSYQSRLSGSVTTPSWTRRLPERSSGSTSPRFSRHSRKRAVSSSPMIIRASEPPMKVRLFAKRNLHSHAISFSPPPTY